MNQLNQDWEVKSLDDLDPQGLKLVSEFFNEHFPGVFFPECAPEIFEWKLGITNPAGLGFLTVAMCNGLVVGTASGTRKLLIENGELIKALEIGDTFTHPDFRKNGKCVSPISANQSNDSYFTLSVFGRLVSETILRAKMSGVEFIYGTPNENSKPPYLKRLQFREIDFGDITANVLLTSRFARLAKIRLLLSFYEYLTQFFSEAISYLVFGRNSIQELSEEDFLANIDNMIITTESKPAKLYLVQESSVFKHRYLMHPNHKYRFFGIKIKGVINGVLITTEIYRASGVRTLVVSDWLFSDPKVRKRLAIFVSKLRSHTQESEVVSYWEYGGYSRLSKLFLGIIAHKNVSVIGKDCRASDSGMKVQFGDFRMGWSDNG